MQDIRPGILAPGILALGFLLGAGIAPARAQMVTDPTMIRSCLCEQQAVRALQENVSGRRQALDAARNNEAALNSQISARRTQINVYNSNEVDAFKQLLEQRDTAQAATLTATQNYDAAASSYDQAVQAYNGTCAGKSFDENVLRQVQATLSCPRIQAPPPVQSTPIQPIQSAPVQGTPLQNP